MSARSPFDFTITEGSDELSIELCANSCYVRFGAPVAVLFDGADPEFYDLTPHYKPFRSAVNEWIGDRLNTDFQASETNFLNLLEPILSKLSNGNYLLSLDAEIHYNYTIRKAEWKNSEPELMELVFGKVIDPERQEKVPDYRSDNVTYDLMYQTTTDIYTPFEEGDSYSYNDMLPILTTKREADMDLQAVRYFEERIRKKERPVILLFRAFCEGECWDIPYILLDGHHKFRAYQNVGIVPRIAIITRAFTTDTVRFMPDELINCLYPWQSSRVFGSTLFNEKQVKYMLENPDSKVHRFVRNGLVKTHYDSGQLKHEATYHFNRSQGVVRGWYPNGQLEFENHTVNGVRLGKQTRFYKSGKIEEELLFHEPGTGQDTKRTWYESGAKKMVANFDKNRYSEVVPVQTWFENGQPEKEHIGTDNSNYESRSWNEQGELLEHFIVVNGVQSWILKPQAPVRKKVEKQPVSGRNAVQNQPVRRQSPETDPKNKPFDYQLLWIILIFALLLAKLILFAVL